MFHVSLRHWAILMADGIIIGVWEINHATNPMSAIVATGRSCRQCANPLRLRGRHSVYHRVGSSDKCYVRNIRRKLRRPPRKCDV
ncbi:hypothetical protein AWB79_06075 [Caballeronia hypogeia]|uniref:Uncharacterized protein n=1 Tax=Caballeronia hypogeia TaxID=1777140 RepID=A0A158CVZ4_9BURK|nr:hypothetical protein AWB79_06075 [Caballeronia hypogeia]